VRVNTSGRVERRTQLNEDRQTAVEVWATMATGPTEIKPAARIASENRWMPTDGTMVGKRGRREWGSFETVAALVYDPSGSPVPGGTLLQQLRQRLSQNGCVQRGTRDEGWGT